MAFVAIVQVTQYLMNFGKQLEFFFAAFLILYVMQLQQRDEQATLPDGDASPAKTLWELLVAHSC